MAISSQPNDIQSRLFVKNKGQHLNFVVPLLLSFIFIVIDCQTHSLNKLRFSLSIIISPLQSAVDYPFRVGKWMSLALRTQNDLIQQKQELNNKNFFLKAQLLTLSHLEKENSELRALLAAPATEKNKTTAAEILALDVNNNRQLVVIDKGSRDGVFTGQVVVDPRGIMGQIIDVGLMTSTILLISDSKSAVPVRNQRTNERAILVGMNRSQQLTLINLPKTSLIQVGDILDTSGLGKIYPQGYPVGQVEKITTIPGDDFIKVSVKPLAQLQQNRLVLLLWPEQYEQQQLTQELGQRMRAMDKFL